MRIRQEMILGIGGVRALRALGKPPTVCHMNEGHSAFCGLERIRALMEEHRLDFATAREAVAAGTVFTTHTPVPAGNDVFAPQLIEHYFGDLLPQLKIDRDEFLGLGRQNPADAQRAVRHDRAGHPPGQRHQRRQQAARQRLAQDVEEHLAGPARRRGADHRRSPTASTRQSWVSPDMVAALRPLPRHRSGTAARPSMAVWKRVESIPDAELWRTHERRRERLVGLRPAPAEAAAASAAAPCPPRSPGPTRCSTPTP